MAPRAPRAWVIVGVVGGVPSDVEIHTDFEQLIGALVEQANRLDVILPDPPERDAMIKSGQAHWESGDGDDDLYVLTRRVMC